MSSKGFWLLYVGKIRSDSYPISPCCFKTFINIFLVTFLDSFVLTFGCIFSQWWIFTKFRHSLKFCTDFVVEMLLIRVDSSKANWRKLYIYCVKENSFKTVTIDFSSNQVSCRLNFTKIIQILLVFIQHFH